MNLSLDVPYKADEPNSYDIQSFIQMQLAVETLDGDNCWHCSSCNDKVMASKFITFKLLPPVLVIHLKRFRYDSVSMIPSFLTLLSIK